MGTPEFRGWTRPWKESIDGNRIILLYSLRHVTKVRSKVVTNLSKKPSFEKSRKKDLKRKVSDCVPAFKEIKGSKGGHEQSRL